MELTMKNLDKCFNGAYNEEAKYIGVLIAIKQQHTYKTVIVSVDSFPSEQKFLRETYNDDLTHKYSEGLRIVGFTHANSFAEIQRLLGV